MQAKMEETLVRRIVESAILCPRTQKFEDICKHIKAKPTTAVAIKRHKQVVQVELTLVIKKF